ncbi:MAG: ABC transporter substrate-binding protein [Nannocystaceae bacterium]|nr:ABC transporter substrate-binding protein [Nannocystaceae bacterium]
MRPLLVLGACALACGRAPSPGGTAERIVSQVVFADEELWALGPEVRARVVAISGLADDTRYSTASGTWPAALPRIAGGEAIVAQQPDLVVTAEFTAAETRAVLEQLGIATLQLEGWRGFDDYRAHVRALGDAVAAPQAAQARIAAFDARLVALQQRFASPRRASVVSWHEGNVAGRGTIFADEALAAGFDPIAVQRGVEGHGSLSLEALVTWDPDYVVVACEGDCDATERDFAARPGFAGRRAAQPGHVIAIPAPLLYSAGVGMLDVVERLGTRRLAQP